MKGLKWHENEVKGLVKLNENKKTKRKKFCLVRIIVER